jgi:hypothetical protein
MESARGAARPRDHFVRRGAHPRRYAARVALCGHGGNEIEERRRPRYQIITDELELRAKDGGSLVLYGFGLERRKVLIDAHVSARARPFRGA